MVRIAIIPTAQKTIILREAFEGGLKHALYSNFSRYTDAFLELSDNSVGNRIPDRPLRLYIYITPKKIEISNYGGFGMNLHDLKDFLKWGKIKERRPSDLGAYSQGGKAAMGYLGREMRVEVSPQGKRVKYVIEDTNLHDYRLKEYRVKTEEAQSDEGFVHIEISGLKRKIRDEELQKVLADTYRPLLESREVRIEYNGVRLKTEKFSIEELSWTGKVGQVY